MSFAEIIRSRRLELHMSQREVAELVPCHKNTVSDWEMGKIPTDFQMVAALERALKLKPGELYMAISYPQRAQVRHRPARVVTVAESPAASTASV